MLDGKGTAAILSDDLQSVRAAKDISKLRYLGYLPSFNRLYTYNLYQYVRMKICFEEKNINYDSSTKSKVRSTQQDNVKCKSNLGGGNRSNFTLSIIN